MISPTLILSLLLLRSRLILAQDTNTQIFDSTQIFDNTVIASPSPSPFNPDPGASTNSPPQTFQPTFIATGTFIPPPEPIPSPSPQPNAEPPTSTAAPVATSVQPPVPTAPAAVPSNPSAPSVQPGSSAPSAAPSLAPGSAASPSGPSTAASVPAPAPGVDATAGSPTDPTASTSGSFTVITNGASETLFTRVIQTTGGSQVVVLVPVGPTQAANPAAAGLTTGPSGTVAGSTTVTPTGVSAAPNGDLSSSTGTPLLPILLSTLGGVVLLAAVAVALFLRRRNRTAKGISEPTNPNPVALTADLEASPPPPATASSEVSSTRTLVPAPPRTASTSKPPPGNHLFGDGPGVAGSTVPEVDQKPGVDLGETKTGDHLFGGRLAARAAREEKPALNLGEGKAADGGRLFGGRSSEKNDRGVGVGVGEEEEAPPAYGTSTMERGLVGRGGRRRSV
ncbi:hypothetical protein HDU96_003629 [Phlyctochytrium bullatum]|nr:hypothetical protein HDU96_003629 [Phlyctochytrium bullatum]